MARVPCHAPGWRLAARGRHGWRPTNFGWIRQRKQPMPLLSLAAGIIPCASLAIGSVRECLAGGRLVSGRIRQRQATINYFRWRQASYRVHGWRLACAWLPWLAAGTIWLNPPAKETDAITSLAAGIVRCASLAAACEWMQSPAVDAKPAAVASDCARARAFEPYCPNERRGRTRPDRRS